MFKVYPWTSFPQTVSFMALLLLHVFCIRSCWVIKSHSVPQKHHSTLVMWLSDHPRPSQPGETAVSTPLTHPSPWSFPPITKNSLEENTPSQVLTSHNANQAKKLINLQCQQPSSKISVNPRTPPVQLCTQNTLVGLKGKEQSTQQEAEGANRAHS